MKCILLCAGYATRLYPLTLNYPKALLHIEENKPVLDYILDKVNEVKEVDEIYLVTNACYYDLFEEWKNKHINNKKPIKLVNDHTKNKDERLGAVGDIEYVVRNVNIKDDIMVIAGDNLFDFDLTKFTRYYYEKKSPVVCMKETDDLSLLQRVAVAKLDSNNKIIYFEEKPNKPKSNLAVFAVYIYPKEVFPLLSKYVNGDNIVDAPGYFILYLYKLLDVYGYLFEGECYDVGTHETLREVRENHL